jgi:hypothetical protein
VREDGYVTRMKEKMHAKFCLEIVRGGDREGGSGVYGRICIFWIGSEYQAFILMMNNFAFHQVFFLPAALLFFAR